MPVELYAPETINAQWTHNSADGCLLNSEFCNTLHAFQVAFIVKVIFGKTFERFTRDSDASYSRLTPGIRWHRWKVQKSICLKLIN
jgi:hypothetical protein